jgi:3-oxoacyl-[acyl-carrier protein] reductase
MPLSDYSLEGQVALVTGSGRGLGHAIALHLAELGAAVAVHDHTREAPAEFGEFADLDAARAAVAALGRPTCTVVGDISREASVTGMVGEVERRLGPISILVNAAGGDIAARGGKPKPNTALGIPMEDIRALIDRNFIGTMIVCRAVVPGMMQRRTGAVVNIASSAGHFGVSPEVVYSSIKGAIVHYTRCLAAETLDYNVRVNCVSPGATMTARFKATRPLDQALVATDGTLVRYGTPRDQANVVGFLCSDAARFVHGQVIRVDGGKTLF